MTVGIFQHLRRLTLMPTVVMALLLVLGFQDFAAQIHVHALASQGASLGSSAPSSPTQGKHGSSDSRDCSLCQLVLLGSAPLPRSQAALWAPSLSALLVPAAPSRVVLRSAVSHSWQGRGPPSI